MRNDTCPGLAVFEHATSRWGVLVLTTLNTRPLRYFELRETLGGVSDKMLSQCLRELVRDGLIQRTVVAARPPRVSYTLTLAGADLIEPLRDLVERVNAHNGAAADLHAPPMRPVPH
ncbi:putative transcriptional regulator, HxlR family [Nocardia nova SH22a]|uniref:Putative transcriptional regulator, HxlR family n=1 Tax=Nocardia nova SH22a TaxID=1415166 RepID=W5TAQ9_9NOCA|nr:helix-turn-helix domain-containing protein [Nocardia nova]AHH16292.1 putative transcriptional regulator, HxlR family [Nocardia nova SH22a]